MGTDGQNDGRFPDECDVLVRYPGFGMTADHARETWPWLPGVIESQGAPDEWLVTVYERELATLEDDSPAPDGTPEHDVFYPQCFRTAEELRRWCRHCGEPIEACAHPCATSLEHWLCKGWRHAGYDSQPVIGHCCGGRSINPAAEPREERTDG